MNKRIISLCLSFVLLLCLLPAAPTAAAAGDVAINETNFPDANFRSYVSGNFDQNGDGILSPAEIEIVTHMSCSDFGIASLKGIEYFTAMKTLYCGHNQLTSLDVSGCTALEELYCFNNQLTSLDVSKNTALKKLLCYYNQLTALDVSRNTALEYLDCTINQLTSLDVSKNTALESLSCFNNQLTSLDVSKNTALE
ncbi:MAG: leucine-rich repeat domain-containing protein, partial [Oscillospiraceae bacterium]|nr:leucine-rich repeat domain-containing protein [Oscillospiraceae bacterium]